MTVNINASTSSGLIQTADTSGTLALQSNGTTQLQVSSTGVVLNAGGSTQLTVSSTGAYGQLVRGTAQAATSGTVVDFGSIPSWVKRITVMFNAVSFASTDELVVRLGTSGGVVATGYESGYTSGAGTGAATNLGFYQTNGLAAANAVSGMCVLANISGNIWVQTGNCTRYSATGSNNSSGRIDLGAQLTTVRVTGSAAGAFDGAGSVNILYEG